jgi:dihydroflavonol-4-reductase
MKVFLTGGNGFIGSAVARHLVASGHDIVCLVRETSRLDRIATLPFTRACGDVRDIASFREAMSACDCTVHLAAPGGWEQDEPSLLSQVIEGGARNVLEVASELRDHRIVVVSSTAAIAASDRPVVFDETAAFSVPDMRLHYAVAKHRAEIVARQAYERGVAVIIVNPAEVYGPGDAALVTAGNLIDFATSNPVLVCRGGTCVVHVDDVASGIVAALQHGRPGDSAARRTSARTHRAPRPRSRDTKSSCAFCHTSCGRYPSSASVQSARGALCYPLLVRRQREGPA